MTPEERQRQLEWYKEKILELETTAAAEEEDDDEGKKEKKSLLLKWPRIGSCLLGVVLPLLSLIGLSMILGLWVAYYEAPYEIRENDQILLHQANAYKQLQVTRILTEVGPQRCLQAYLLNKTDDHDYYEDLRLFIREIMVSKLQNWTTPLARIDKLVSQTIQNITEIDDVASTLRQVDDWMEICGEVVNARIEEYFSKSIEDFTNIDELSFNWIRCVPGADGIEGWFDRTNQGLYNKDLVPILLKQSNFYQEIWNENLASVQQQLIEDFLHQHNNTNATLQDARYYTWEQSISDATGKSACELNPAAAGWFWFTIMSTMGYGNQVPNTEQGRVLVYTLGFVSIILFGFVLQMAGLVSSAVVDDILIRFQIPFLNTTFAKCILWGSLYYGWMAVTAAVVMEWKHDRLQDPDFDFEQGYWFAYVSSTTIGLGDIHLEPLVIQPYDMFIFPFLLLVNFVFLSAFLTNLGLRISKVFRNFIVTRMVEQMEKTNAFRKKTMKEERTALELD